MEGLLYPALLLIVALFLRKRVPFLAHILFVLFGVSIFWLIVLNL